MAMYDQKHLNRIHHYQTYHDELGKLNRAWDAISTMGAINQDLLRGQGTPLLTSMRETRAEFTGLQARLFSSLVDESVAKVTAELTFFAQNTIDVLIRNLYERTADVGFLATDSIVSAWLAGDQTVADAYVRLRLQEYVKKYTVYDEIVLLDNTGTAKLRLQSSVGLAAVDGALRAKLQSAGAYIEYLDHTNLLPQRPRSHIFARAVHDERRQPAPRVGHLLMFFRFEDELERIFSSMRQQHAELVLLLLDSERRVLVSSDELSCQPGAVMPAIDGCLERPLLLGDREYFSITRATTGYQGYMGLEGLKVMALVPFSVALNSRGKTRSRTVNRQEIEAAMSPALRHINRESAAINRKLRIITVNGKCLAARLEARTFVPILENIQDVGSEITRVVSESIGELNQTAVDAILSNCQLYSSLAIDLMDRNLYERANDCRWWAMTPAVRALIENPPASGCRQPLHDLLRYINDLYTVYTNLIIYDHQGRILACSDAQQENGLVGTILPDPETLRRCMLLRDGQSYTVSDFVPTSLYGQAPTYIYHAAIRSGSGRVIAGVGVVFDAEPEFRAMLEAALPRDRDGGILAGAGGLYVDRQGLVISSTDTRFAVGQQLTLPSQLSHLQSGQSWAGISALAGCAMLLGATASSGYREYKTSGDYQNDVIGIIFVDAGDSADS